MKERYLKLTLISTGLMACLLVYKALKTEPNRPRDINYSLSNYVQKGLNDIKVHDKNNASTISERFFIKDKYGVVSGNEDNIKPKKSTLLENQKRFSKFLTLDNEWWINNFELASTLQKKIISEKQQLHYSLIKMDKINLKYMLALSILLNTTVFDAYQMDYSNIDITDKHLATINAFVNSPDFDKMVKFKTITEDYLQYDNLKLSYQYDATTVTRNGRNIASVKASTLTQGQIYEDQID